MGLVCSLLERVYMERSGAGTGQEEASGDWGVRKLPLWAVKHVAAVLKDFFLCSPIARRLLWKAAALLWKWCQRDLIIPWTVSAPFWQELCWGLKRRAGGWGACEALKRGVGAGMAPWWGRELCSPFRETVTSVNVLFCGGSSWASWGLSQRVWQIQGEFHTPGGCRELGFSVLMVTRVRSVCLCSDLFFLFFF